MSSLQVLRNEDTSFFGMLGSHSTMLALYDAIHRAAALDAPVVVSGPTGSGKELVARALHALSVADQGPFCPVNVAALPEGLIESELFGSMRGAFTGAVADRRGLIEAATGGTLFLDEASHLAAHVQAKLLRVIEYGEVRRVGSTSTAVKRFRLVTAIQEDPTQLLGAKRWRADFYYRLTGVVIRVPSLSERRSDIPVIAKAFLKSRRLPDIEQAGLGLLARQAWPGNVRELQQALVRAAFHCANGCITVGAIRAALADGDTSAPARESPSLQAVRHRHVRDAVSTCGGDTQSAAALLGISRSQVYRILKSADTGILPADSHPCE